MIDAKRLAEIRELLKRGRIFGCVADDELLELVAAYEALRELVETQRKYDAVKSISLNPVAWRDARQAFGDAVDRTLALFPEQETPND